MDDLLELLEESAQENADDGDKRRRTTNEGRRQQRQERGEEDEEVSDPPEVDREEKVALSVDDRVDIRMKNRNMSGFDLLDLISSHPYHSCAQLAAMSLQSLNKLLQEPAPTVDAASVQGKTELVTVGLVFSNSGTRVAAASGQAFCVVTMGNLATGPTVKVLLFGAAYQQYCKSCRPGKVAALVQPRLMAHQPGDSAAVTFSVHDARQFLLVAEARDYGRCQHMMRGKNEHGQWAPDAKQCTEHVDKRVGQFCAKHHSMQSEKNAAAAASGSRGDVSGGTVAMLKLREEAQAFSKAASGKKLLIPPKTVPGRGEFMQPAASVSLLSNQTSALVTPYDRRPKTNNPLLQRSGNRNPPTQGLSLETKAFLSSRDTSGRPVVAGCISLLRTNTYGGNASGTTKLVTATANRVPELKITTVGAKKQSSKPIPQRKTVQGDLLQQQLSKQRPLDKRHNNSKKRARVLNTDTGGFDGTVPIPKPKQFVLRQAVAATSRGGVPVSSRHESTAVDILSRQQQIAEQVRAQKAAGGEEKSISSKARKQRPGTSPRKQTFESVFGTVNAEDLDRVANAKSHFEDEANAQEYARSRRVVTELEKEEEAESHAKGKKTRNETGSILKAWHCRTCGRSFSQKPIGCMRLHHNIKVERKMKETATIAEQRTTLMEKSVEDGGLKLGSGLEWSRYRYRWDRFS
jgi:rubrerythrin